MSTRDERWPEGTPAWVDLMVPDRQTARKFYGPLFGWDFEESGPEYGYYTTCLLGGRAAAAIGSAPDPGEGAPGPAAPPPSWTTYLATNDIAAAVERAVEAGGQVIAGPLEIGEMGSMAVLADPTGAVFGLWESGTHTGADVVDEPGALVWNEVMTRDVPVAREFYRALFPYTFGDMSGPGFTYMTLDVDGRISGGLGGLPSDTPSDVPSAWTTYFAVKDTDAWVSRALALGGRLLSPAADSAYGRMAVIQGPFGETFAVMSTEEESTPPLTS
ncbi:VOC family protein [Cellulomonas sp. P22]|uniref:VOC family protein n=1 Tax=Cellulomonas sp. P22 TaxID=3373189 RepID=UPI0037B04F5E